MDIDCLYRVPKDLCWQHLKQNVDYNSIDLALYKGCVDKYITKKTLWNTLLLLKEHGVICIETCYESLGFIIDYCKDNDLSYDVVTFYNEKVRLRDFSQFYQSTLTFVFIYKSQIHSANNSNILRINDHENFYETIISRLCSNFTFTEGIILLIGDAMLPYIDTIKNLYRYIIAFGNDNLLIDIAQKEGMFIKEV